MAKVGLVSDDFMIDFLRRYRCRSSILFGIARPPAPTETASNRRLVGMSNVTTYFDQIDACGRHPGRADHQLHDAAPPTGTAGTDRSQITHHNTKVRVCAHDGLVSKASGWVPPAGRR